MKTDLPLIGRKISSVLSSSCSKALSPKLIITVLNTNWFEAMKHSSPSHFQGLYFLHHCLPKRRATSCHLWASPKWQHFIHWNNHTQVWKINIRTKGTSHSKGKNATWQLPSYPTASFIPLVIFMKYSPRLL